MRNANTVSACLCVCRGVDELQEVIWGQRVGTEIRLLPPLGRLPVTRIHRAWKVLMVVEEGMVV